MCGLAHLKEMPHLQSEHNNTFPPNILTGTADFMDANHIENTWHIADIHS